MARTVQQIYDSIIAEKDAKSLLQDLSPAADNYQTFLNDLNSPSKVAVWRLWIYIVAIVMWTQEQLWEVYKADLLEIAGAANVGTRQWYRDQVLNFQYGYSLTYNNEKLRYEYAVIDEAAKIVKHVAVEVVSGSIRIKTAKEVGGVRTPLSTAELASVNAFIDTIYLPGDSVAAVSFNADLMKVTAEIHYDPLVLNTDGSLIVSPSIFPVHDAINEYLRNLDFNGDFNSVFLVDAIQASTGVKFPVITNIEAKYGVAAYANVNNVYSSIAGYIKHDDTPGNSLDDLLTFIPNV